MIEDSKIAAKLIMFIFATILVMLGAGYIAVYIDWKLALAIFCWQWADNILRAVSKSIKI